MIDNSSCPSCDGHLFFSEGGKQMKVITDEITTKSMAKQLIMFVIPIWLGMFFQQLYNTADAIFVGNYVGKAALAAVGGPAAQIVGLLIGIFVELAAGCAVIIAQYFGANSGKKVGAAIHTAISIALLSGVLLTAAGLVFSPALLRSMEVEGEIYDLSLTYPNIYFCGTIFITIYNLGSSVLRALGDSKQPFYFLVVGCIINIVLDYILICWVHMGVAGAAIATVFSQAVTAALVIRALCKLPEEYKLNLRKVTISKGILKRMLRIGIPESMQAVLYSTSNILIQANIDRFGTDTIAAWSAYGKVDVFYWMTLESFGIAITTIAGQYYGAGKIPHVRKSVKICLSIVGAVTIALCALLLAFGEPLFRLFSSDPTVIQIGLKIQHMLVPFYCVYIFVTVMTGALRGMGYAFVPMLITFVGICMLRVVWLYLVVPINPVLTTTIISYPVTWSLTSVAFIFYYRSKIKSETRLKTV